MSRRGVLLWALLVPAAYAPSLVLGSRASGTALLVMAGASALALGTALAVERSRLLDRLAARLDPVAKWLLMIAIAAFVAVSIAGSLERLAHYRESAMLGLFSQCCWTQLHGFAFANSQEAIDGGLVSHLGLHFSPTLLVLLPFYTLWPHPIVLMAAQALAIGLAPVPLFLLLRPHARPSAALCLSVSLLGLPVFAWSGFVDFRDSSFLPVLLLSILWAMERRRWGWLALFTLAALGVREDTGLVLVALAVYALATGRGLRVSLLLAAAGMTWVALIPQLMMSRFASPGLIMDPERFFAAMFGRWGPTPGSAALAILTHPGDVIRTVIDAGSARYLYSMLLPLLLLPAWGDWAVLAALPGLAFNLLSAYPFMRSATTPYALVPLTFFALAAFRLATRLAGRAPEERRAGTGLALGLIVLAGVLPSAVSSVPADLSPPPPPQAAARVVAAIPANAPVYAPLVLYPYLHRREHFDTWWNVGRLVVKPEFRARYPVIVVWRGSDPPGEHRDGALADSLAVDPRFVARPGFEPFEFFERR